MNTDARRKASREYHQRRIVAGERKVTVWLSEAARAALENLALAHGSKDAAVEAALLGATPDSRLKGPKK